MITNSTLVFVDWDSARRIIRKGAGEPIIRRPDRDIEAAIEALQEEVANVLRPGTQIRRISWRIYHGWHQGTTSTDDRRLFEKFVNGYSSRRVGKLSFGEISISAMRCFAPRGVALALYLASASGKSGCKPRAKDGGHGPCCRPAARRSLWGLR